MTELELALAELRRCQLESAQAETAASLARVNERIARHRWSDAVWDRCLIRALRHDNEGERT